jgi:hypothetical protein
VIRAYVKPNDWKGYETRKLDVESIFAEVEPLLAKGGMIVVRCPDDATMFEIVEASGLAQKKAQGAVQLIVGSSQHFWSVTAQYPDGDGWRLILASAVVQSSAQQGRRS